MSVKIAKLILLRLAAFYLFSVNVGGISNILAYGLLHMEGFGGLRGWQWIFVSLRGGRLTVELTRRRLLRA
jgi:hypothetical protein